MSVICIGAISSDDDLHQSDIATPADINEWGLTKGPSLSRSNVVVRASVRGRSAYANRDFRPGDFVCEYCGVLKPRTIKVSRMRRTMETAESDVSVWMLSIMEHSSQLMPLLPSMTLGALY